MSNAAKELKKCDKWKSIFNNKKLIKIDNLWKFFYVKKC